MKLLKYIDGNTISIDPCQCYESITFDGCYYYITVPCMCKVIQIDSNFNKVQCMDTVRGYNCICYDWNVGCFWATNNRIPNKVFRLDNTMTETNFVIINQGSCLGNIKGISYNCCNDNLLVAYSCGVYVLCKKTGNIQCLFRSDCIFITSVLSLCPSFIISYIDIRDNIPCVAIIDFNGNVIDYGRVPNDYNIRDMILNPCGNKCIQRIYMLATSTECSFCLLETQIQLDCMCKCNHNICGNCKCNNNRIFNNGDVLESIANMQAILDCVGNIIGGVIEGKECLGNILYPNQQIQETAEIADTIYVRRRKNGCCFCL